MSNLDPKQACRCNEPAEAGLAVGEPVRKVGLPEGMTEGTFTLMGMTAEELGREVDRFLQAIDYSKFGVSADFSVTSEVTHLRGGDGAAIRSTFGPYFTSINVWRRA